MAEKTANFYYLRVNEGENKVDKPLSELLETKYRGFHMESFPEFKGPDDAGSGQGLYLQQLCADDYVVDSNNNKFYWNKQQGIPYYCNSSDQQTQIIGILKGYSPSFETKADLGSGSGSKVIGTDKTVRIRVYDGDSHITVDNGVDRGNAGYEEYAQIPLKPRLLVVMQGPGGNGGGSNANYYYNGGGGGAGGWAVVVIDTAADEANAGHFPVYWLTNESASHSLTLKRGIYPNWTAGLCITAHGGGNGGNAGRDYPGSGGIGGTVTQASFIGNPPAYLIQQSAGENGMKGENNTSDVVDYAEFVLRATHYYNAATPAIEVREIGNKSKYKLYGKGGSSIYWVGAEPGSHQATNGKNGNAGCGGGGGQYPNSGASSGQSLGGSGGAACVWIYY